MNVTLFKPGLRERNAWPMSWFIQRRTKDLLDFSRRISAGAHRYLSLGVGASAIVLLLAVSPAQAINEPPNTCDRLAASPYDENAVGDPVTWIVLARHADQAITACREAVETFPDTLRLKYQLARAFDAAEQYNEAAPIYQELADIAYPSALAELGVLYSNGQGVENDPEKALELVERSAELGNLRGLTIAGVFHTYGLGTEKDVSKGMELLNQAANQGFAEAMEYLADAYLQGLDGEVDQAKALELYEKAARNGRRRAILTTAQLLYKNTETHDQAYYWFSIAARTGNTTAMMLLAKMIASGEGTEKSEDRAIEWMLRAGEAGDSSAYFALGRAYETGQYTEKNPERAKHWYQEGVKASNAPSAYRLARGYDKGEYGDNPELAIDYLVFAALSGFKPAADALLRGLPTPWTESSRKGLQARLKAEGHYSGPIDGITGPATLGAVPKLLRP